MNEKLSREEQDFIDLLCKDSNFKNLSKALKGKTDKKEIFSALISYFKNYEPQNPYTAPDIQSENYVAKFKQTKDDTYVKIQTFIKESKANLIDVLHSAEKIIDVQAKEYRATIEEYNETLSKNSKLTQKEMEEFVEEFKREQRESAKRAAEDKRQGVEIFKNAFTEGISKQQQGWGQIFDIFRKTGEDVKKAFVPDERKTFMRFPPERRGQPVPSPNPVIEPDVIIPEVLPPEKDDRERRRLPAPPAPKLLTYTEEPKALPAPPEPKLLTYPEEPKALPAPERKLLPYYPEPKSPEKTEPGPTLPPEPKLLPYIPEPINREKEENKPKPALPFDPRMLPQSFEEKKKGSPFEGKGDIIIIVDELKRVNKNLEQLPEKEEKRYVEAIEKVKEDEKEEESIRKEDPRKENLGVIKDVSEDASKALTEPIIKALNDNFEKLSKVIKKGAIPGAPTEKPEEDSGFDLSDLKDLKKGKKGFFRKLAQRGRILGKKGLRSGKGLLRTGANLASRGVSAATGGAGITGLLGTEVGAIGSLGAGAVATTGALVLGTAAAGAYTGYKLEEKFGLGTKALDAVGYTKDTKEKEKAAEDLNEKLKSAASEKDPINKKIKFFEAQKESLENEIKTQKGEDLEVSKRRLEMVEKSLEKLKQQKETSPEAVKKEYEKAGLLSSKDKDTPTLGKPIEAPSIPSAPKEEPVKKPAEVPSVPSAPKEEPVAGKPVETPKQVIEEDKGTTVKTEDYKSFTKGVSVDLPAQKNLDKLKEDLYNKAIEGHPYNPSNPEFQKNPKLWEALKGNKPGSSSLLYTERGGTTGSFSLTEQPSYNRTKGMKMEMERTAAELSNSASQKGLDRAFLHGMVDASRQGISLKTTDMGTITELIRENKISEVQKILANEDPELMEFVPKELKEKSNILPPAVMEDVQKGIETLGKTNVEGLGGTDVSGLQTALKNKDYNTLVEAIEYISKVQKRDSVPLKKETYEALTGQKMSPEKAKMYEPPVKAEKTPAKPETALNQAASKASENILKNAENGKIGTELTTINDNLEKLISIMTDKSFSPTIIAANNSQNVPINSNSYTSSRVLSLRDELRPA